MIQSMFKMLLANSALTLFALQAHAHPVYMGRIEGGQSQLVDRYLATRTSTEYSSFRTRILSDRVKTISSATQRNPSKTRSEEWKQLPRQSWEAIPTTLPPHIDQSGFDTRSLRPPVRTLQQLELEFLPTGEKIESLGRIVGSKREGSFLTLGDIVYIEAEEELKIGERYTMTHTPSSLKARKADRSGYSYLLEGGVRIQGVKDNLYIGKIESSRHLSWRGSVLIKDVPIAKIPEPIPGKEPLEAVVVLDQNFSVYTTAQHKQVAIDKGTEDGVTPGMIFRAFEHFDPVSGKRLTHSDFMIVADLLVIHSTETFSVAVVLETHMPLTENTRLVLMTDLSELRYRKRGFGERITTDQTRDSELEQLDKLDGGAITTEEKSELKQLEGWDETQPTNKVTAPPPVVTPAPDLTNPTSNDTPTSPETTPTDLDTPTPPSDGDMDIGEDELAPPEE